MNLVPFASDSLRIDMELPFALRDADGKILLPPATRIGSAMQLEFLRGQPLYAEEAESAEYRRRLAAAVDTMIRRNADLKTIAETLPAEERGRGERVAPGGRLDDWRAAVDSLHAALRRAGSEAAWWNEVQGVDARLQALAATRYETGLYMLIYDAGHGAERYSAHHALLCALVVGEAARLLDWPAAQSQSLRWAALAMNASMARLQDLLAAQEARITPELRAAIDGHAAQGARLLAAAGAPAEVVETVRSHHDAGAQALPAQLLRRIDVFTARMSRRRTRAPLSPFQAAREACLGPGGKPDAIGQALLKAVGMYPPGSFVELASGERGIVVGRGRRLDLPLVATVVSAQGAPVAEPALRDTVTPKYAVKAAVAVDDVRVVPPHEKVLALR